jgi:hypothetical protein
VIVLGPSKEGFGVVTSGVARAKKAYREAYDNEEIETLAAYGYEVRLLM